MDSWVPAGPAMQPVAIHGPWEAIVMSAVAYAVSAVLGTALLAVVVVMVGLISIGLLAPIGGFVAHERAIHHAPRPVRRGPAPAGFHRTALHH